MGKPKKKEDHLPPHQVVLHDRRTNIPGMLRDVLLAIVDRGQLIPFGICVGVTITIVRMPQEELPDLIEKLVAGLDNNGIYGYLLFIATLIAWRIQSRSSSRRHMREKKRIGDERNKAQEEMKNEKLISST